MPPVQYQRRSTCRIHSRILQSGQTSTPQPLRESLSSVHERLPDDDGDVRKVAFQDRDGRVLCKERVVDDGMEGRVRLRAIQRR